MIAKCPYCNAEMEGDAVIGDLVECPICLATFTVEQKHVIPEVVVTPPVSTRGRVNQQRSIRSENNGIDRYLTGGKRPRRFEHLPALIVVGLVLLAGGAFAWKTELQRKVSLPWPKMHRTSGSATEDAGTFHSPQDNTQKPLRGPEGAKSGKVKKRNLTEAERAFKEALDALLGENGQGRDIVKAYKMFEKASDMKYELAEVALAHIAWNMSEENQKAFEKSGVQSPARFFYSIYPTRPILPAWVSHSSVAKFEQGLYQMKLGGKETNLDGMMFIAKAAEEGLPIAKRFLNSMVGDSVRQGLDVSEATFTAHLVLANNPELVAFYQRECDNELKNEFLRATGVLED